MHKKLVCILGLNWKSPQRALRQQACFASAKHLYIPRLNEPYPPKNHWVVETQPIWDMWKHHLTHRKLHDKRTGKHPMDLLDYNKLAANIPPGNDAFIYNATTCSLICVVIQNLCCLHDPLAWVDYVVQEAVDHRRPTWVQCLAIIY
jgi:hypothetical protein